MESVSIFVGLDYHQSGVQVCVMDVNGQIMFNQGCANDWQTIAGQVERFGKPVKAAVESCSGDADLADELVTKAGWHVDLGHPGYVSKMKQNPDKTDFSDARMLADLERVGYLPKVWLAPIEVREMRMLVRYRQQSVNQHRAVKLRIGAVLREQRAGKGPYGRWSRPWLWWLENEAQLSEQARWVVGRHLKALHDLKAEIHVGESRVVS